MLKRICTKTILLAMFAFPVAACFEVHLFAQELSAVKGGLGGTVTDTSGAVITDAKVTVTGSADTRVVNTDPTGRFLASGLTPGLYTVTVERQGFATTTAKNLQVEINRINNVEIKLNAGAETQTVEVSATAVSTNVNSTAISSNLSNTFYEQVPMARNVGSLFYTAPSVTNGGQTGSSNPSIGGASGLENQYIADGVNITDAGYGGMGVFSPIYGSLGTGINLTFIQEVQVKTGAFEPKYGNANGGVVQIVTKSGGTAYHGALSAFFAPDAMSAGWRYPDNYFDRVNVRGHVASLPAYDAAAEFGGYVPGELLKNRLFFFGAYNPALKKVFWSPPSVSPLFSSGPFTNKTTVNSWAAKVTFNVNETTSVDASAFSDPSRTNAGLGLANKDEFPMFEILNVSNETGFSRWNYGTRSETVHLTSTVSPTFQVDLAVSAKLSHFTEVGVQDVYQILDFTNLIQNGQFTAQGLGYAQNPTVHDYGFGIDLQKTATLFKSQHTFSGGVGYIHSIYALTKDYSGGRFTFPTTNISGTPVTQIASDPALSGASTDAAFYLQPVNPGDNCAPSRCPYLTGPLGRGQVYLQQVRGIFSSPVAETSAVNLAAYVNDDWKVTRFVTLNLGIRWDEEQLNAVTQAYVFNDNWSPRLGINVDPFGKGTSKVFFNYGRYTQSLPQDAALRDLSNELDINTVNWRPEADGNNNAIIGPNGTVVPVLDSAHLISGDALAGAQGSSISTSGGASPIFIAPQTKLNYETEFVGGIEHQIRGFVLSARYTDRRLLRIIEDGSGASPEGNISGNVGQNFVVGNYSSKTDYFVNEIEAPYTYNAALANYGAPANCPVNYNAGNGGKAFLDSVGQVSGVGGACGFNTATAGLPTPDGKPDGFADPRRHYQAFELEANKNFSHNFLLRANYRYAKLFGNYEGLFRNDNDQSDPSISSLYDFTVGELGLLGGQFARGFLNTDRRQVGNLYGSYVVPRGFAKRLTGGIGLRGQSGQPISELASHPVYHDTGEVPIGVRGDVGTNASNIQLDLHLDYTVPAGEKFKIKGAFDTFNLTNSRSLTAVDNNVDLGFGDPNVDYLKPTAFQHGLYARGSVRFEF